jgi:molybdopterin adenylyltransferase
MAVAKNKIDNMLVPNYYYKIMKVNIAILTVTDTRTLENDKSGAILVKKIEEVTHNLIDRKICKDDKEDIKEILKN